MGGLEFDKNYYAVLKVIGIGGGGSNAVNRMMEDNLNGCEFIAVNTDAQALMMSNADRKVLIGESGLGAGSNPEIGKLAADKSSDSIREVVHGADMVFITCGEGGGTGTGAAPVIAEISREEGCLTVAVVTKPFTFEGVKRSLQAEEGINSLRGKVDCLIIIPNDKLLEISDENTTLLNAFKLADNVLKAGVRGVTDLITLPGLINLDFADVKSIIKDAGNALLGDGIASGDNRAIKAAQSAINSPLIETSIDGAKGILLNVSGGPDLKLFEVNEAAEIIRNSSSPDANIIFGAVIDENMKEKIKVTIIATGFKDKIFDKRSKSEKEHSEGRKETSDTITDENKKGGDREKIFPELRETTKNIKFADEDDVLDIPTFLRKDKNNY
ncbi:MAG: cell division protein FtsZ [Actinobacteria bacterium]|nr:cell division protein FtsZ [Cyanobacteriota bacterium]MCL6088148.1 cell division protein FtsZ [Actinomycetota bacterium]